MRRNIMVIIVIAIAATMVNSASAIASVSLNGTDTHILGESFEVEVLIDTSSAINCGAQMNIEYNESLLMLNSVIEGNYYTQNGASTFFGGGTINNTAGTVVNIFGVILGNHYVSAPGEFIVLNFTVIGIGANGTSTYSDTPINFSLVKMADPEGNPVPIMATNGNIKISTLGFINFSSANKTMLTGGKVSIIGVSCANNIGTAILCSHINWNIGNISIADIDSTGKVTTKNIIGATNIFATSAGITGSLPLIVEDPRLETIIILPATKTLKVNTTLVAAALGKDQVGNSIKVKCAWSSSNNTVATVNAITGKIMALKVGSAIITATNGTVASSLSVTVIL